MKKALIVDDSRLACKVMANMLGSMEIESFSVYSAEDALQYLQTHIPDVIFLDHTMPGISGLELIQLIKDKPSLTEIPVLMYTAKEGKIYAERAKQLGAIEVLPKGLEKNVLTRVLSKIGLLSPEVEQTRPTPASPPTATTPTSGGNHVVQDLAAGREGPVWQSFWVQKAEPYLNKTKLDYVNEIQLNTKLQTRQLKREFHQTLESFEHAVFHRMQSHNEFIEAQEQLTKKFYRKVAIGLGGFGCFLLLLVFSQLWQLKDKNQQLLASLSSSSAQQLEIEQQILRLNQRLESLAKLPQTEPTNNDEPYQGAALVDQNGELISELRPVNASGELYTGKTQTGYQLVVNSQGELGLPIKERYYLAENCEGDSFVDSPSGSILKDSNGGIWYVDRLSSAMLLTVKSKLNDNNTCTSVDDELLNLNRLHKNQMIETGINSEQLTELYFNY